MTTERPSVCRAPARTLFFLPLSTELKARWAKEHLEALQARIRLWVKEEASHPITKDDVERGHHDLDKNKLELVKDATESRSVAGERRSLP